MEITHKFLTTNGIKMHVAMAGEGPIVLLCHGFPESWYSWRHQLKALAKAGYCAVAPDMRGYGQTDKPEAIDQYTLLHLTGDMVGLVEALGFKEAVIVGHDWGAQSLGIQRYFDPISSRVLLVLAFHSAHAATYLLRPSWPRRTTPSFINCIFRGRAWRKLTSKRMLIGH